MNILYIMKMYNFDFKKRVTLKIWPIVAYLHIKNKEMMGKKISINGLFYDGGE